MTKEKKASLTKYVSDLSNRLSMEPSAKHLKRNSVKELHAFLKLEIERTKAILEANALNEGGK